MLVVYRVSQLSTVTAKVYNLPLLLVDNFYFNIYHYVYIYLRF